MVLDELLHTPNLVGSILTEAIFVTLLDELWQWELPWLLPMIVEFAKFLGIETQFSRHLHMGMR